MRKDELLGRYEALGEERDFLAAKPLFERALAEGEDARLLNDYGYLLFCHARRELRLAVEAYERAVALEPGYDKPHYQLISARASLLEPERSVADFEARLAASPDSVREHRFLAQAYLSAHAYAKALAVAEAGLVLASVDGVLTAMRVRRGRVWAMGRVRWRIGDVRSSWSRRTSALCTAVPSCSSARVGSPRRAMPGSRSSPGMRTAATSWRRCGCGRNSNAYAPRSGTHEATLARMSDETEELWAKAADRIRSAWGWSLRPLAQLGRPRDDRRTWLAEGEAGPVIVKLSTNPFAAERAEWAAQALRLLRARGSPAPELLWSGPLDERWFALVQTRLPGEPLRVLDRPTLDRLLALVDLQADPGLTGGWNVSWWIGVVLFEGWEHWWEAADSAAPETARRLRSFLEPACRHRLPVGDLVHGDLNLSNVLVSDGEISGVVDWDHLGLGSRALDLTSLLFDWQRLRLASDGTVVSDGGERLVRRTVEIAGEDGLRCTVAYAAVARLALSARRGEHDQFETWRQVSDAILGLVG